MLVKRVASEIVDIIVFIGSIALALKGSSSIVKDVEGVQFLKTSFVCIMTLGAPIFLQSFFWKNGRSIGKTYFGLVVVDEFTREPVDIVRMVVREIFSKALSIYIVCLPLIQNKPGIHEISTQTRVVRYDKKVHNVENINKSYERKK